MPFSLIPQGDKLLNRNSSYVIKTTGITNTVIFKIGTGHNYLLFKQKRIYDPIQKNI